MLLHQVWIHVVGRAAKRGELLLLVTLDCESKVNELYFIHLINQNIVEFEVPVDDRLGMHEGHSFDDLGKHTADEVFLEAWLLAFVGLFDEVEEALAFAELHDEEYVRPGVDYLVQRHNIDMVEHCQSKDLSPQRLGRLRVLQVLFVVDFQGNNMSSPLVRRPLDRGKGPLPNLQLDREIIDLKQLPLLLIFR